MIMTVAISQTYMLRNWKWTLSDSIGEDVRIKLRGSAVWSVDHLFPDLCHLLQTRRQFLVLRYHQRTGSFRDCSAALLRLVRCHGYDTKSQLHQHNRSLWKITSRPSQTQTLHRHPQFVYPTHFFIITMPGKPFQIAAAGFFTKRMLSLLDIQLHQSTYYESGPHTDNNH